MTNIAHTDIAHHSTDIHHGADDPRRDWFCVDGGLYAVTGSGRFLDSDGTPVDCEGASSVGIIPPALQKRLLEAAEAIRES